jgi:hypothetical protein
VAVRRIAIGPGEVAGYFSRLKAGFDAIGIPCDHYVLAPDEFSYGESDYFLAPAFRTAARLFRGRTRLARVAMSAATATLRGTAFFHALARCDVFILPGFGGYLGFFELGLLRLLGKRTVVVYLGSDARPPFFSGRHLDDSAGLVEPRVARVEAVSMLRRIRRVERNAHAIVNHTATAQFFERSFTKLLALGIPAIPDPRVGAAATAERSLPQAGVFDVCRVLHAPSRPIAKGSAKIRKIVQELRDEGDAIELVELVGVPNQTVLAELAACDFVVDELYSDSPMAALAAEAARFGKPTVVGGFYASQFAADNAGLPIPPSLFVAPDDMKGAIRRLVRDRQFRKELGVAAQAFVRDVWSGAATAERYLLMLGDRQPLEWVCCPAEVAYIHGWGLSTEQWRTQVAAYVEALGPGALLLGHAPELERKVLNAIAAPAAN